MKTRNLLICFTIAAILISISSTSVFAQETTGTATPIDDDGERPELTGKEIGSICTEDSECQSKLCLFCPNMKMLLAGYLSYEDLPDNAVKIDFSVIESGIVPETHQGSVIVIDPAPSHGYCAGGVLPTSGPKTEEYINKVHQAYIDNNILEEDEPFIWGPGTFDAEGGAGYCIGTWNNDKYKWILAKSGDEQYIDLTKDAFLQYVSEAYFDNHMKLISINRPKIGSINYGGGEEIYIDFSYSVGKYDFPLRTWIDVDSPEIQVQQLKEIETLLPEDQAFDKLKAECLPSLEETRIILSTKNMYGLGTIVMQGQETISLEENKCKFGALDMETGEILECREAACYVTAAGEITYKPSAGVSNIWIYVSTGIIILIMISVILLKRRKS
ncbi:MAG: hypothetical protein J7K26_02900 [Candidatus Aenigmarchaeota archaeon]|nr:hypothetical protein [Candidatus Aenigmarchaeota archaeon]